MVSSLNPNPSNQSGSANNGATFGDYLPRSVEGASTVAMAPPPEVAQGSPSETDYQRLSAADRPYFRSLVEKTAWYRDLNNYSDKRHVDYLSAAMESVMLDKQAKGEPLRTWPEVAAWVNTVGTLGNKDGSGYRSSVVSRFSEMISSNFYSKFGAAD